MVVAIDGQPIGEGKLEPIAQRLRRRHIEPRGASGMTIHVGAPVAKARANTASNIAAVSTRVF